VFDENALRHEASPYLLQHRDNPVHWQPWGPAALQHAKATNRPILLSIGYAACHWCHVMAHESFEDAQTAALMNEHFVCIKVDREERPDVDHIYMTALHAMGEAGGWPLTMFLRPDGAPFWGGTYFPPTPRWGRPSFRQVLTSVAAAWAAQDRSIDRAAAGLTELLSRIATETGGDAIGPEDLDQAAATLLSRLDRDGGGFNGAPKFPNAPVYRFLVQDDFRRDSTDGRAGLHTLLQAMARGGIHDHLGGGFARYATDEAWLVPHFEKMLSDNGQLLELLAQAMLDAPHPLYREASEGIVAWMTSILAVSIDAATGSARVVVFAASEDADSEGEEGAFYVWTEAEIDAVLGDRSPAFKAAYDVTPAGNWEHRTILRRVSEIGPDEAEAALASDRERLAQHRAARPRPHRDDKVLTDWNALTVVGLCKAGVAFNQESWVALARSTYDVLRTIVTRADGRLLHSWRDGTPGPAGFLDDYAALARAALALYGVSGQEADLRDAVSLADAAERLFADPDGGYCLVANDTTDLPPGAGASPRVATDSATPSGAGMMADVLARLALLTGDEQYRGRAEALARAFAGNRANFAAMGTLLAAVDTLESGTSVVIAGDLDHPSTRALAQVARTAADPAVVTQFVPPSGLPPAHPASGKRAAANGDPVAYVCRGGVCEPGVTSDTELRAILRARRRTMVQQATRGP
jgi:uncharacterized protein YyaL (SSP411 family)